MYEQASLEVEAERFTSREKQLIKHLKAFRTIDADIRALQRVVNGYDLPEPSVTARPRREDDPEVMWMLEHDVLSESQAQMAAAVERYVSPTQYRYASSFRVAKAVGQVQTEDPIDRENLQLAYSLLHREIDDTKLNETEHCAEIWIRQRENAKVKMYLLIGKKDIISGALEDIKKYYPEWWTILWYKFVQDEPWIDVCKRASRGNNTSLTPDEYRTSRKNALIQFDKWTPGLQ